MASSGLAGSPQTDPSSAGVDARGAEQLVSVVDVRREAATQEYEARIAELKAGRSPATVALQSNRRLLQVSLAADSPNAAIQYDRRAYEIETIAMKNLQLGTGTEREVAQAKAARLDAILKGLLIDSE